MSDKTRPVFEQLNFRVPRDLKRKVKSIAAAQGVSVQELGADLIAIYLGVADTETIQRRDKAAKEMGWCALKGSNLGPLPCEGVVPDEKGLRESTTLPILLRHESVVSTCMPVLSPSFSPLVALPIAA